MNHQGHEGTRRAWLLGAFCALAVFGWAQGKASPAPEVVPVDQEPMHKLVFENEYVRVFSVEVSPGGETKYHRHERDYVGVILGDADVESVRVGEAAVSMKLKDGDTRFTQGGFAHKAVNKGDKPFRNVTVELKKGPQNLAAGPLGDEVPCEGGTSSARKCYAGGRLGGIGLCSHCDCPKVCFETKGLLTGQNLEIDETVIPKKGKYFWDAGAENPRMVIALSDLTIGTGKYEIRPDGTRVRTAWPSASRESLKAGSLRWLTEGDYEIYPSAGRAARVIVFRFASHGTVTKAASR